MIPMSEDHKIGLGDMIDHRPFLLPGYLFYFRSNFLDPHMHVLTDYPGVTGIPPGYSELTNMQGIFKDENGEPDVHQVSVNKIILNFGFAACKTFEVDDQGISTDIRFKGIATRVYIPAKAIICINESKIRQDSRFNSVLGYGAIAHKVFLSALPPETLNALDMKRPGSEVSELSHAVNTDTAVVGKSDSPKQEVPYLKRVK